MPSRSSNPTGSMTGARMTMLSWAKLIDSFEAVPEVYKGFFKTAGWDGVEFPHVVLTPAIDRWRYKLPEKLICDDANTIYVLERAGDQVIATGYPFQTIRDVETGEVLLRSWITISGVTDKGASNSSRFEFNTTSGRHFAALLNKLRPAPVKLPDEQLAAEQRKFDSLAAVSFKFMNYARSSLIDGEKVLHILWQPEMRVKTIALPGWPFYRTITPAHLTVLTDKELILIWDDERANRNKVRHGGVWRYIPLHSLVSTAALEQANSLMTLSIYLTGNDHLDRLFAVSSKSGIEQLRSKIEPLLAR
jgi:hypothetical protein